MINPQIQHWLTRLKKVRVAPTKFGKAPHKPVLIISLIELLEKGLIAENKFFVSAELVAEFKENWSLLVDSSNTCDFSLPFFHLQTDGFWEVILKSGKQLAFHIKSIFSLIEEVDFARLDSELFLLLTQAETRKQILKVLLEFWFPEKAQHFIDVKKRSDSWFDGYEKQILSEPFPVYNSTPEDEDIRFVRSAVFQTVVPKVYNFRCCISGMKVLPLGNYSLIDACHIIPFRENGDNSINNGIALCPNLHRAFDRNLIGINADYQVIVSEAFEEFKDHPYSIRQFHLKKILLPDFEKYWPDRERLQRRFQQAMG